jgi:hypothetical protein
MIECTTNQQILYSDPTMQEGGLDCNILPTPGEHQCEGGKHHSPSLAKHTTAMHHSDECEQDTWTRVA